MLGAGKRGSLTLGLLLLLLLASAGIISFAPPKSTNSTSTPASRKYPLASAM